VPSQFSNLNFYNDADIATWKERCADQRKIAEEYPAYDPRMALVEEYQFNIGPWRLVFYLEVWGKKPMWHGGASIQEQVAYETVTITEGMYAGTKMEVPQDALLAVSSWMPEHFEQARYILAEVFGPILKPGDKFQPAEETRGLFTLQWRTPYRGKRNWQEKQH
jgi:hypothetical protein